MRGSKRCSWDMKEVGGSDNSTQVIREYLPPSEREMQTDILLTLIFDHFCVDASVNLAH